MTSDRPYRAALSRRRARAPSSSATPAPSSARAPSTALLAVLDGRPGTRRLATCAARAEPAQPESELRALIAVAGAVAAAHRLEDVLEVVAEETRRVVGASSVSISRWEREHDRVQTLINVGELGPGEERFPTEETLRARRLPARRAAAARGRVLRHLARRRATSAPHDRQLLDALDKGSYIGVPVIFDGRTWGKLEAFANVGARAVHAPARAVPGGDRRPGRRRDRPRRAVLARQRARLRRPAHRPRQPARARRAAGAGGRARRRARDRVLRPRRAQADQRLARPRGGRRRDPARGRRAGAPPRSAHAGAYVYRVGGDEFCVVLEGGARTPPARSRPRPRARCWPAAPPRSRSPAARPRCARARARPTSSAPPTPRSTPPSARAAAASSCSRATRSAAAPAGGRRARRDRTPAETRALAERLLAAIDGRARRRSAERGSRAPSTTPPDPRSPASHRLPVMDAQALRAEFPVLERVAYLNSGTDGPLPAVAVAAARAELDAAGARRAHDRALRAPRRAAGRAARRLCAAARRAGRTRSR